MPEFGYVGAMQGIGGRGSRSRRKFLALGSTWNAEWILVRKGGREADSGLFLRYQDHRKLLTGQCHVERIIPTELCIVELWEVNALPLKVFTVFEGKLETLRSCSRYSHVNGLYCDLDMGILKATQMF